MSNTEKLEKLEKWLKSHNAEKVGDIVYDGMGKITSIEKGLFGAYKIHIMPIEVSHNLGSGYGCIVEVKF